MRYQFILIDTVISLLFIECETRRIKRVVGGAEVECGTQPRVASLQNVTTLQHLCGAYLLTPAFAVTAAHCVHHKANEYQLELRNFCDESPTAQVDEKVVHTLYDMRSTAHDVALLRIRLDLEDVSWLNDDALPALVFGLSGGCTIYGYGSKEPNSLTTSDKLLAANVDIVSLDYCRQALGPIAPSHDEGMMCAVGDGADSCQGDSGGPLICNSVLQGISSYGQSCGVPGMPGVYTSIGAHLDWIRHSIKTSSKNTGDLCENKPVPRQLECIKTDKTIQDEKQSFSSTHFSRRLSENVFTNTRFIRAPLKFHHTTTGFFYVISPAGATIKIWK